LDVQQAINGRRSIRKYKSTPVSQEKLMAVLEAARQAPTWANTQCCSYVVVTNNQTKEKLAEILAPRNPATEAVKTAPVIIVACAELKKAGFYKGVATTDKGDSWYMFDTGIAMQNLCLAAWNLGLGTVHVGNLDAKKAADIIGVPPGVVVVELTPLGYPDEEPAARPRKEMATMVFYEKYGQTK